MDLGNGQFEHANGWENVVSIGARAVTETYPAIAQVDAYWEGLRNGRPMPKRSEVDPRGLEGALEYAMLMELVAPGVARIRVAGMHMMDLLGLEVRGMPITAFFEPADRERLATVLNDVVNAPKVAEITLKSRGGLGRPPLTAKLYLAPLLAEGDGRPRLLACLQAKGGIGRTPRRFQIEAVHKRRIVASARQQPVAPSHPARGFAEPQMPYRPAPATPSAPAKAETPERESERPYLRLVKSD